MSLSFHSGSLRQTDLLTDIHLAASLGYDGIELWMPKVESYLASAEEAEGAVEALLTALPVTMIDVLIPIETADKERRQQLLSTCRRMASLASKLNCAAIQVVALDNFADDLWPDRRNSLVSSLLELSDITAPLGIRLGLEPVTFAPLRKLSQALDLIDRVGSDRLGLVLDTWHLWTAEEPWQEVSDLSPDLIVSAQISDTCPRAGEQWEDSDRSILPGDGILPLAEAVRAIQKTGFDGPWSVELHGDRYAREDPKALALEILTRARAFLAEETSNS